MSRFKELERIDMRSKPGRLRTRVWAASYCEMRLRIARLSQHQKTWRERLAKVRERMGSWTSSAS